MNTLEVCSTSGFRARQAYFGKITVVARIDRVTLAPASRAKESTAMAALALWGRLSARACPKPMVDDNNDDVVT